MPTRPLSPEEATRTKAALDRHAWNITHAAEDLGITRSTLQHRIKLIGVNKRFEPPVLPSPIRDIEELVADRIAESKRTKNADEARDLIKINVNIDGPFGLLIFGDPHVDNPGCDFETLASHRHIAMEHPFILAGNIGDNLDNWIGRP